MKITLEQIKNLIMEILEEEMSHDSQADSVESMQHQLESEKPKKKKKIRRKSRT